MLSNLLLSVAWKQIGLGFKILLSRHKLTREGIEGLIWMQADTGFSEDFDVLKKTEVSEEGELLVAIAQRMTWVKQAPSAGGMQEVAITLCYMCIFNPSFCFRHHFQIYLWPPIFFCPCPCSLRDLSSLTRDQTWTTAGKALNPNHCTAREFPIQILNLPRII